MSDIDDTDLDKDYKPKSREYYDDSDLSGHEEEIKTLMQHSFIKDIINDNSSTGDQFIFILKF